MAGLGLQADRELLAAGLGLQADGELLAAVGRQPASQRRVVGGWTRPVGQQTVTAGCQPRCRRKVTGGCRAWVPIESRWWLDSACKPMESCWRLSAVGLRADGESPGVGWTADVATLAGPPTEEQGQDSAGPLNKGLGQDWTGLLTEDH